MNKEGFSKFIVMMVAAVLVVGIIGYYLGSMSNESAEDNEDVIVPEDNAAVPEQKPAETTPPATEVTSIPMKEWIIEINNYSFVPSNLTIGVNDRVTWVNEDHYSHKIMADHAEFVSRPLQNTNDTYSFIFTRAGAYTYRCGVHGDAEKGEVVVK